MRIVCSWCRHEGRVDLVGEKHPFDDGRETHGICASHFRVVQKQWRETVWISAEPDSPRPSAEEERHGLVVDARQRFARSVVQLWSELKDLVRKAAGF